MDKNINNIIDKSVSSFDKYKFQSRYARSKICQAMSRGIADRREDLVSAMVSEAFKPRALAEIEVSRAINTFSVAADEAKRFTGNLTALDIDAASKFYGTAQFNWVPRGVVFGITPFNFPLNLVCHKVAPALASGNAIIIKPAPQAPKAAFILEEIFNKSVQEFKNDAEAIPDKLFQVANLSNDEALAVIGDPRIKTLSFTGSAKVGWMLQGKAVGKKVCLELGGNAAVIVHDDAELLRATKRIAFGAFSYAGQVCISVQRAYVHEKVMDTFLKLLIAETQKLGVGDPNSSDVMVGPVIDEASANRIDEWVQDAIKSGAKVLLSGKRDGNLIHPWILTNVPKEQKISCEEVFGPVLVIEPYRLYVNAINQVNASKYGLQAGVFTDSEKRIHSAIQKLEVGAVMINDVPTYRADHMPYGGVKDSGLGREGVRYAMEEFSEMKTVVRWNDSL